MSKLLQLEIVNHEIKINSTKVRADKVRADIQQVDKELSNLKKEKNKFTTDSYHELRSVLFKDKIELQDKKTKIDELIVDQARTLATLKQKLNQEIESAVAPQPVVLAPKQPAVIAPPQPTINNSTLLAMSATLPVLSKSSDVDSMFFYVSLATLFIAGGLFVYLNQRNIKKTCNTAFEKARSIFCFFSNTAKNQQNNLNAQPAKKKLPIPQIKVVPNDYSHKRPTNVIITRTMK